MKYCSPEYMLQVIRKYIQNVHEYIMLITDIKTVIYHGKFDWDINRIHYIYVFSYV